MSEFWLRGLCPSSSLDTVYKLRQDLSQVHSRVVFSISWNAMWMLFCTLSWIRVDDSLGDLLVGSSIGLGENYWQIITDVKNGSKNSALVYHFLLLYELKFVRRSEWAVENPRFPRVGAEVNSTPAQWIEPFYFIVRHFCKTFRHQTLSYIVKVSAAGYPIGTATWKVN